MSKIGIFFGPAKGSVQRVADKIKNAIGVESVEMISVNDAVETDIKRFDKIIFGISTVGKETWDSDFSNTDWSKFFPKAANADYTNKKVAIFGLGDHITYPGHFVNAMGMLAKEIMKKNATIVGQVDPTSYEFDESEAIIDGKFIGLPIDEDFEPEQTDKRIASWLNDIKPHFGF